MSVGSQADSAEVFDDDQTFHDEIEGYGSSLSCRPGGVLGLHVSTRATTYDVLVERWGAERRHVWRAEAVPGSYHPPPVDADSEGCRWPVSIEVPIGERWESGFYLVTLTAADAAAGRDVAHVGFVVRAESTQRRSLLVLGTNTWNAYNTWGGKSLYTGGKRVSFGRPFARGMLCRPEVERDDRKARPTRWGEEPDADGLIFQRYRTERHYPSAIGSTGWFTHERRFVEWAEANGYRFDYAVSSDLDTDEPVLDGYRQVISVGHDEYWSAKQRDTLENYIESGGNFASFSGNTMFWQVRLEPSKHEAEATTGSNPPVQPTMVSHKYTAHLDDPILAADSPELTSGLWADPLVGRPEWSLLGAGSVFGLYHRFGNATARGTGGFLVFRPDHWLMEGTGLGYGDLLGASDGVVGYETVGCPINFDQFQQPVAAYRDDLPEVHEIIGYTPSSNLGVGDYPKSIAALSDQGDLEFLADRVHGGVTETNLRRVRNGNAVMVVCRPFGPSGGEVVTIGTTDWVFGLASDPCVARVTANVLTRHEPA